MTRFCGCKMRKRQEPLRDTRFYWTDTLRCSRSAKWRRVSLAGSDLRYYRITTGVEWTLLWERIRISFGRRAGLSVDGFIAAITSGIQSVFRVAARDKEARPRWNINGSRKRGFELDLPRDIRRRSFDGISVYAFRRAESRYYERYLFHERTGEAFSRILFLVSVIVSLSRAPRPRDSASWERRNGKSSGGVANVPQTRTSRRRARRLIVGDSSSGFRRVFATRAGEWRRLSLLM